MGGTVSHYAASFGNSWKVPDQENQVLHWIHWMSISVIALCYHCYFSLWETMSYICALWIHTESNRIILKLIWYGFSSSVLWHFYCIYNKWQSAHLRWTLCNWVSLCLCLFQGCSDAAELGHSCDVSADPALRRQAESVCYRLLENPFTHCHLRVRQPWCASQTTLPVFAKLSY